MDARIKSGHDESTFSNSQIVIARSEATKQSISPRKEKMDCAEPVIGAHSRDPLARNGDPRRHALNPSARRPCESRDPYAVLYRFWRAVRDLSFQRTPVVMDPCFRTRACTHLENRLKYRDLDDPRFWKRLHVGP